MIVRIYGFSAEAGLYLTFWNKLQMLIVETDSLHPGGNHHEHKLYRAITFFIFRCVWVISGLYKGAALSTENVKMALWTIFTYSKKTLTGELYSCVFLLKTLRWWLLLVPNFCRKKKKMFLFKMIKLFSKSTYKHSYLLLELGTGDKKCLQQMLTLGNSWFRLGFSNISIFPSPNKYQFNGAIK